MMASATMQHLVAVTSRTVMDRDATGVEVAAVRWCKGPTCSEVKLLVSQDWPATSSLHKYLQVQ